MMKSLDPFNFFGRSVACAGSGDGPSRRTVKSVGPHFSAQYFISRYLGLDAALEPAGVTSLPAVLMGYDRLARDTDLLFARLSPRMSQLMRRSDVLRVPESVTLSVSLPLTETKRKKIRHSQKHNLRRIEKNNFSYDMTNEEECFEDFFHNMYMPYAKDRFGAEAQLYRYDDALQMFRRGGLMWVRQNGRIVAGHLIAIEGRTARGLVFGTIDGRREPIIAGAHSASYWFTIEWAIEKGFRQLNLGRTRPSLSDGVLTTKRRWGAELSDGTVCYDLIVHWAQWSDHVRAFLAQTPLIFHDEAGLSGLTAMPLGSEHTPEAVYEQARTFWAPGLKRLIVISDLATGEAPGQQDGGTDTPFWIAPPSGPRACVQAARPMFRS